MRTPCVLLLFALTAPAAQADPAAAAPQAVSVDDLKRTYLACERAATGGRLNSVDIMQCSTVYEELKRRAFDGDFYRLLAWSRAQAPQKRPPAR